MAAKHLACIVLLILAAAALAAAEDSRDSGRLRVSVYDEHGEATPVRVRLTDLSGHVAPLPPEAVAVMYGMWDHADGYAYQPDSSFYVDGGFSVGLEPGEYILSLEKGNEYLTVRDTISVGEGEDVGRRYRLERWIDTPAMGWYSADDHIHIRRSPREDSLLLVWTRAEDIHVGNFLRMGDFWEKFYSQYAFGEKGTYQRGDYMLTPGQEDPRTPELGHALGLGADAFVRFPEHYYLYDLVFDGLREHGGIGGFAHQAESFHGYRGLTLDGLRGKVDLVEILQYCVPGGPLITDHYYDLLNLGFKVTATAGSDFPWCGKPHRPDLGFPQTPNARLGNVRFYTQLGDSLTYDAWRSAIRAGHTVVSSGPMLLLEVNGALPGDEVHIRRGESVRIKATAMGHRGQVPLRSLEVIGHGKTLRQKEGDRPADMLQIEMTLRPEHSLWIAARTEAGFMQVAHTTPVYVMVDGQGFHDPASADSLLDQSERYLDEIEEIIRTRSDVVDEQAWRYREGLDERIRETRETIRDLRERLK